MTIFISFILWEDCNRDKTQAETERMCKFHIEKVLFGGHGENANVKKLHSHTNRDTLTYMEDFL